jgi:hypothetical protein
MSLPIPPSIAKGQLALDPVNGIVYYKDENNNTVATTWSWLQNLNQETNISSEKNVSIEQDLTVGGDLIISGDTVSLNVSQVLIEDNILVLNYNFTGAPILDAGIEIERGSENNVQIRWNEADNKWQFTNDGTTFLDLNSIIENSVTLGLHTIGNYVKNLIAGTGVTISNASGEGATPNISIGQPVATTDTVTFAGVTAPLTGNVTGNLTGSVVGNVTGNVTGNLTGNVTGTVSDISNHGINDLSDVTITSSADGDFLRWTGSAWVNDAVNLTSDTVGDYVKSLVQGNGLTISNNSGEGATPNIAIDTSIVQTRVTNVTDTEIGYLDGVTSGIQTQLDTKAPTAGPTFTGTTTLPSTTSIGNVSDTEIGYLDGVTSAIQTQMDAKAPLASPTFTGSVTLPANTISQVHLSDDSVGTNEIVGLAVTTGKLADGAVTSVKIANDTIVDADINSAAAIAQSKISGLTTDLGLKAPIADPTFTGTVSGISKSMVGLGNVDNTSDANKPISTATQTALDLKANSATPTFTGMATIPKITVGGIEIDTTSPADTNVLKYNASLNKYIPGVASTVAALDDLTDVIISAATPNQILKYDGSNWVNAEAPSGTTGSVYLATIGDGSTSTFVLTHGLSTRDLVVSFTETTAPYGSFSTMWEATTLNTITVYFDQPPASSSVRASVYGSVSGTSYPSLSGSMYSGYHGNAVDTAIEVHHGMATRDVFVQVRNAASPYEIYDVAWESTTTNKLTLYFDLAPALDSVYVMVYAALSGVSSTSISGLTDVTLGGLANGDFLRYNGSVWINDPVNLSTDTVGDYVKNLVQGTGITITNNSGEGATPTISVTASTYQPLDADLTAIAALAGTSGLLKKTAADTWALDTNTYITSLTLGQLTNVSAATPSNDEVLAWQSSTSQWINKTFSASVATLDAVGDVTTPTPSSGDVLQWSGSAWINSSVVNANISNSAAIAYSKLSLSNSVDYTDLKDGPAKAGFRSTINAQTGTSYSLVLSDLAKMVTMDNASAMTLTVPTNASHGFAIGDRVDILRKGSGTLTVQGADGSVTVNATPGLKIRAQWSSATLIKLDTNTWVLIGDLQA